jgi:hypothetical protein
MTALADARERIHDAIAANDAARDVLREQVMADVLAGHTETPAIAEMRRLLLQIEQFEDEHVRYCRNVHGAPG